jgi:hypothetical protein
MKLEQHKVIFSVGVVVGMGGVQHCNVRSAPAVCCIYGWAVDFSVKSASAMGGSKHNIVNYRRNRHPEQKG